MTPATRRILIVDDHSVLREGLRRLIGREKDMAVCGEAEDAATALTLAAQLRPDLALVDISLREGDAFDLIRQMTSRWPDLPVLVLSMHSQSFIVERALLAGARGYVTKGEAAGKMIEGIRRVLDGERYVSDEIMSRVARRAAGAQPASGGDRVGLLSQREFQVFELIGQGRHLSEIAHILRLSVKTVDAHRENVKSKLGLPSAKELLKFAVDWIHRH